MTEGMEEPVRVFSDLHLGHPGSRIEAAAELRPLIEGARTVVFNGDTREMRAGRYIPAAERMQEDLTGILDELGVAAHYLTGNHDTEITDVHHLDLCGGRVLVTHGDALFPEVSPWSCATREGRERLLAEYDRLEAELEDESLEAKLLLTREMCKLTPVFNRKSKQGAFGNFRTILNAGWPPRRAWHVLRTWLTHHRMAAQFCGRYRPEAKFFVMGHTHLPGVWKVGERVVINTGGFISFGGARLVELEAGEVRVRAVRRAGEVYVPGRTMKRFAAGAAPGEEAGVDSVGVEPLVEV